MKFYPNYNLCNFYVFWKVYLHDIKFSGLSTTEKISSLIKKIESEDNHVKYILSTELEEIACIFNFKYYFQIYSKQQ